MTSHLTSNPLILRIFVEDKELRDYYCRKITEHIQHVSTDPTPDSGFDLCVPEQIVVASGGKSTKVDLKVKCVMLENGKPVGFYTYPRSSISKTPLILANHVGIIDSGYRGNLIAMFRNAENEPYEIAKQTRMIQICHPSLKPFLIELCDSLEDLGETSRGAGGFGSTGK